MEIADIFVVNKADRDGVDRLVQAIRAQLSLHSYGPNDWKPPILKTVATTGEGVPELWAALDQFKARAGAAGDRRRARHAHRLRELLGRWFFDRLDRVLPPGELDRMVDRIASGELDPYTAAADIMNRTLQNAAAVSPANPGSRIPDPRSRS